MPPALSNTPCPRLPGTTSWVLAVGLLLSLLWVGHFVRPALVPPQASHRPATAARALIMPSVWRPQSPRGHR